ncbi:UNVERIFIED_CONTAM: hypothetical protein LK11_39140 [Mumia flava]
MDETLVCTGVAQVTHDVRSFTLAPTESRSFAFEAGQYVTVRVDVDGVPLERCYSISSPPSRTGSIEITVKRVLGGPVSTWLHDQVGPGSRLHVAGPYGRFTRAGRSGKELWLSAGSGITPMMAMARELRDRGTGADVVLVHNARTPRDILFRRELEAPPPGLEVAAVCERDADDEAWHSYRGLLTLPMLTAIAPDLLERDVLLCGPPAYMAAVRELLAVAGVDPGRCREERFELGAGAGETPDDGDVPPPSDVRLHSIELRRSGRTITCDAATTILEATASAGVRVPSSCHEGLCGTCKSDLLSGSVDMQHQGGIRPREIREGKILLCCSTPTDDLVIDA